MKDIYKGRRLVISHNPHSSRASEVQQHVFDRLDAAGYAYTAIEVQQAHLDDNIARLAPLIRPGDIVLSAAGDGSAHATAHAVMAASQPGVELGFLAYGNFNDLPNTLNSKATLRDPVAFLEQATPKDIWPIHVSVDDTPLRSALLYASIGWTASAASQFDDPKIRYAITNGEAGVLRSLWRTSLYYLKTRHHSNLPPLQYEGKTYKVTDLLFANGLTVARLFKTGQRYFEQPVFLFRMLNVRWVLPNVPFLLAGLLGSMSGQKVSSAVVDFEQPMSGLLQCDGEVVQLEGVGRVEVKKATQPLTVLATK